MGIRTALGARRSEIVRATLASAARVVFPALLLGGLAAMWTSRWLESQVVDISTRDPLTMVLAVLVLLAAALAAAAQPALRAARTDPVEVLRTE
jgi:ABC-type antimicrobial peptide transport system permease subunit